MGIFSFLKSYKKVKKNKKEGVQPDYPFNLRVDGIIKLDETPFLFNSDLNFDFPGGSTTILAIGKFKFYNDSFYRAYLKSSEGKEPFLQFNIDGSDVILFDTITEIYPQSESEWNEWLEPGEGYIGQQTIEVEGKSTRIYNRVFGGDNYWTEPIQYNEHIEVSKKQSNVENYEAPAQMMLYEYKLESGESEYIMVNFEEDENDMDIRLYIGINIKLGSLEII